MSEVNLQERVLEALTSNRKEPTRHQRELQKLFSGEAYRNDTNIVLAEGNGEVLLRRNKTIYHIRKSDTAAKRWDFIFFVQGDYKGKWFQENQGHFFLVKKSEPNHVYFDDLKGFDCYLGRKHTENYEIVQRYSLTDNVEDIIQSMTTPVQ